MSNERVGIVIQARMKSRRLPGKALLPIAGQPLLQRLCERLRRSRLSAAIVVATSETPEDDAIADACRFWGVTVHRGPERDLTSRLVGAARAHGFTAIVRATADNPSTDPEGVDHLIAEYVASAGINRSGPCIFHNAHRCGYLYGTGAELVSLAMLEWCDCNLHSEDDREYFIQFVRMRPQQFPCKKLSAPPELRRPNYFLTVDYPEDLRLQAEICDRLGAAGFARPSGASLAEIVSILDQQPELTRMNRHLHEPYAE